MAPFQAGCRVDVLATSHHFFIVLCVHKQLQKKFSLVCMYGDPRHLQTASLWGQVQNFVVSYPNLPVICMGDLNNIMNVSEKLGPKPANIKRIADLCCMIKDCGLLDLDYNGPAYTWSNKWFSINPTYERLDRCLGNANWCASFTNTMVYHLPMMKTDHAPILAVLTSSSM